MVVVEQLVVVVVRCLWRFALSHQGLFQEDYGHRTRGNDSSKVWVEDIDSNLGSVYNLLLPRRLDTIRSSKERVA